MLDKQAVGPVGQLIDGETDNKNYAPYCTSNQCASGPVFRNAIKSWLPDCLSDRPFWTDEIQLCPPFGKLEKRTFQGFTKIVYHPRFQAKNADFMYNVFNGRFDFLPYNYHKIMYFR